MNWFASAGQSGWDSNNLSGWDSNSLSGWDSNSRSGWDSDDRLPSQRLDSIRSLRNCLDGYAPVRTDPSGITDLEDPRWAVFGSFGSERIPRSCMCAGHICPPLTNPADYLFDVIVVRTAGLKHHNGMQRHATACNGMQRHATARNGTQRHACWRRCNGM